VTPDVVVDPALDNAEHHLPLGMRFVLRALRPANRPRHALFGTIAFARVRQALVEDHCNVGADHLLHRHRLLGAKKEFVTVQMGVESATLFGELAHLCEREDLKPSGVGENRTVTAHEIVKSPGSCQHLSPGTEHQMIGITENHLSFEFHEVANLQRFHRAERPHVHENRSLDYPMGSRQSSQPRVRTRIFLGDFKTHAP